MFPRCPTCGGIKAQSREDRLLAVFEETRDLFARVCPSIARAVLVVVDGPCTMPGRCAFRDMAYALPDEDPPAVVVLRRLADLPDANVVGLMLHEFGHLCDVEPYVLNTGREQAADDIVEAITGRRVFYDDGDVQTISPGKYPRPAHLHR